MVLVVVQLMNFIGFFMVSDSSHDGSKQHNEEQWSHA